MEEIRQPGGFRWPAIRWRYSGNHGKAVLNSHQCRLRVATALIAIGMLGCENPQPPMSCGAIPQQTVTVGQTGIVSACFNDPNGDLLTYVAVSSNPGVAAASATGTTVTITAVAPGNASVTVTATDPDGMKGRQAFQVLVPNRPPLPRGTIPAQTIIVGQNATVNLSSYFTEPDGQSLTYSATAEELAVATPAVSTSVLTVTAITRGVTAVTVTVTDPGGLTANQAFQVVVPNRAPVTVSPIPDQTIESGDKVALDLSPHFDDPDGDSLTYSASATDPRVATLTVRGNILEIVGGVRGTTDVKVTARDPEGLAASQSFPVMIPNRPPVVRAPIPGQTVNAGETVALDVSAYFGDPDGDALTYEALSSDPATAAATVQGQVVSIAGVARGEATVTVVATDPGGLTANQAFQVVVPNRAPVTVSPIPDQTIESGDKVALDLSPHFDDPDGDSLTYSASATDPRVATLTVRGNILEIVGGVRGTTDVKVTARDPEGLAASQSFPVMIPNRPPVVRAPIPGQTVNAGETVALDVSAYFGDPDGDALTYEALSSDPATAAATVQGQVVSIAGVARGEATVTVVATDPGGLHARSSFMVDVFGREAGQFHIELVLATEMTGAQEEAFRDAAELWMSILAETELPDVTVNGTVDCSGKYEQSVETIDDLMIVAAVVEIDGPGQIVGRARPCRIRREPLLPYFGMMEFDAADLGRMERNGTLKPVILHEMAHILGIGSLWRALRLLTNPSLSAGRKVDT